MAACECDDPEPVTVHLDPPHRDHELRYQVCTECDGRVDDPENGRRVGGGA